MCVGVGFEISLTLVMDSGINGCSRLFDQTMATMVEPPATNHAVVGCHGALSK